MTDSTFEEALAAFVGRVLLPRMRAQDPVNQPMIRHWTEAMGDENPIFTADEAARRTGRLGVVAPATMVQAWTMRGYAAHQRRVTGDARCADAGFANAGAQTEEGRLLVLLASAGYTAVVATDSEFAFARELVPGDHIEVEEVLESVSAEKKTALGPGRFLQTVRTYTDASGAVVATQRWRTLRFRPAVADPPTVPTPRPRPALNADSRFWFEAAREHRLLVQRCVACGTLRHPPGPCCPHCRSFASDTVEASGRGTVYSFTVAHHPRHPAFDYPIVIAVIALEEGTRLIANIVGCAPEDLRVDVPVALEWVTVDSELTLPAFRIVTEETH